MLNKQGDNTQPWRSPFPIWNQLVVQCPVLTVASWPAYRFLKRQVRWSGIPISFRIFQFVVTHTVKGFGIVNKTEIIFLELSCFLDDPVDVGNLIYGSSAFSKSSLNIWRFLVHVLLKPGLENFKPFVIYVIDTFSICHVFLYFIWGFFMVRSFKFIRIKYTYLCLLYFYFWSYARRYRCLHLKMLFCYSFLSHQLHKYLLLACVIPDPF